MASRSFLARNKFLIIITLIFMVAAVVYILAKRKSRDEAIAAWEDYLGRSKDDPSQRQWREQAELHLRRLEIEPIMERAAKLAAKGSAEKAIEKYKEVTAIDDKVLDAHLNIARLYRELGEYENAAGAYEEALAIAPYSLKIRYETAQTYEEFDRDKAIGHWEEFVERADAGGGIETEKRLEGRERLKELRANR